MNELTMENSSPLKFYSVLVLNMKNIQYWVRVLDNLKMTVEDIFYEGWKIVSWIWKFHCCFGKWIFWRCSQKWWANPSITVDIVFLEGHILKEEMFYPHSRLTVWQFSLVVVVPGISHECIFTHKIIPCVCANSRMCIPYKINCDRKYIWKFWVHT